MAVPPCFHSFKEYFDEVLEFLKDYQWVYKFPNTHVLVNKVFEQFPDEWIPFLGNLTNGELNNLSLGHLPDNAPATLKVFFEKINKLKVMVEKRPVSEIYTFPKNSGLSRKKEHEIVSLTSLIHEIYEKNNCDLILDVGTGLGYLPRLLYQKYKYCTLGIEGSSEKVRLAKIQQKKFPESTDFVTFYEHFITHKSDKQIKEVLMEFPASRVCVTGLHACADLSVIMLDLFTKLETAKSLVIMPCCYHRLRQTNGNFDNFPASKLLKESVGLHELGSVLKVPFLRLACQNSGNGSKDFTEEQHEEHAYNCLFRAVLQDVAESENWQVRRLKRKSGKSMQLNGEPFENYLTNLKHTHTLVGAEITDHQFLRKMREKWMQHKGNSHLVEALAAFQAAMQGVCENVVLLDRVVFLHEKGVDCFVVNVTDRGISPRCHALVATKP